MGVIAICDRGGYVVSRCRCMEQHTPTFVKCDHQTHDDIPQYFQDVSVTLNTAPRLCQRCGSAPAASGDLCSWCVSDLARLDGGDELVIADHVVDPEIDYAFLDQDTA